MEREPLPYPHERNVAGAGNYAFVCQLPEHDPATHVSFEGVRTCAGCRAGTFAIAAADPHREVLTPSGRTTLIAALRETFPDYDPIRVLLERHLAKRGG